VPGAGAGLNATTADPPGSRVKADGGVGDRADFGVAPTSGLPRAHIGNRFLHFGGSFNTFIARKRADPESGMNLRDRRPSPEAHVFRAKLARDLLTSHLRQHQPGPYSKYGLELQTNLARHGKR